MGNFIDLPNINPETLILDNEPAVKKAKNSTFDEKNYLNIRLAEGEEEKTIVIRLLPMDLKTGNPFVKIHVHNVQVPKEMVQPGQKPYKSYICLRKTEDIDHERFGRKCPFCDINYQAYQDFLKETDPVKKEDLKKLSIANKEDEAVIVRCIERGKENEGVKFWKFNIRNDKTDPYNQIIKLFNLRKEAAAKKGKVENILDIYEGKDLVVTITNGTSAPTITDDSERSPLSDDAEQMKTWIFDSKKWQDVFTCKTYEYLKLVSELRVPWYDKANNVWVDKKEFDAVRSEKSEKTAAADKAIEEAKAAIVQEQPAVKTENEKFIDSITDKDDEDGLPF